MGSEKVSESGDGEEGEKGSEEKPLRLSGGGGSTTGRRQRGSPALNVGNPDLLTIPGVGPRNLRKLVEKGIGGLAELKQLYKDKVLFSLKNVELFCSENKLLGLSTFGLFKVFFF
jgi:predicted flap endonuclease-1-like 5' DNA nuclease